MITSRIFRASSICRISDPEYSAEFILEVLRRQAEVRNAERNNLYKRQRERETKNERNNLYKIQREKEEEMREKQSLQDTERKRDKKMREKEKSSQFLSAPFEKKPNGLFYLTHKKSLSLILCFFFSLFYFSRLLLELHQLTMQNSFL
jgi:hypothetical protein